MGWSNPYIPTTVVLNPATTVAVSNFPASVEVSNDVGNALPVRDANQPPEAGTWDYRAGSSGTKAIVGRVIGIAAHAPAAGAGTVSINGGDAIPVPAGFGIELAPKGNVTNPSITFTGTDSYMIEFVT